MNQWMVKDEHHLIPVEACQQTGVIVYMIHSKWRQIRAEKNPQFKKNLFYP